jgi:drug/metabolite transporter (DMT)-like permease
MGARVAAERTSIRDRVWVAPARSSEPPLMRRPAVYVLAATTVTVLGLNWPIMSNGVDVMPAMWLGAFRMAGAAVLVAAIMAARGALRRPSRRDLPILLTVGLLRLALVTGAVFAALRFVPPGRSSILVWTSALWTAPMAALVLHERLTALRLGGLALGCAGIVLLLEPWSLDWSDGDVLTGLGLLLLAAVASSATTVHVRAHRWRATPLELMPWQFAIAAGPLILIAFAVDGAPSVDWTLPAAGIVTYQVALASAFGVWGGLTLMRSMPAISANLTLMAIPVVGLGSSILLVDEPATVSVLVSLALVLSGVALGLLSDRRAVDEVPLS